MKILIQNGRVVDPASGRDERADVAIAAGRIIAIGAVGADFAPNRTIDASDCIVAPGLVDLSVRLREPGQEHAAMLESEMAAAVAGGVTSLVCPPDTDPVLDEPGLVDMLKFRAEKLHLARVFPLGALTRGLKGEVLTNMAELTDSGCVGFGQAEVSIVNTQVLQRALQYAATFGYTVWLRPSDAWLGKGVAASGPLATRMGLSGVPAAAETIALHTLFELMRAVVGKGTAVRVHICRISSAAGLALVRQAKAEGLPVSCDVSVHNLHLTDVDMGYYDSRFRVQPPLRQQRDRDALRQGLADGTIDAICTDHAPHSIDEKEVEFIYAPNGIIGLETAWGVSVKRLLSTKILTLDQLLDKLVAAPRRILRLPVPEIKVGAVANLTIFDVDSRWTFAASDVRSKSKNTPYIGADMHGRAHAIYNKGRLVVTG